MLRVARRIGREGGVRVRTTYLGLHATPPEHRANPEAYVDEAVEDILPAACAEGLVDAVDAYCEPIAFSPDQVSRLEVGLRADLAAWDIQNPAELAYWLGKPVLHARWLDGVRS